MKRLLFNWSLKPSNDKILNSIKSGVLKYLSYNLSNGNKNRLGKFLKYNLTLILLLSAIVFTNGYFYNFGKEIRDPEVKLLNIELNSIYNKLGINNNMLNNNRIESSNLKKELRKIKSSRIYMDVIIFEESNIKIPKRVNDEHLKLMIKHAELNDIPFNIFFRLIYKESNFKWNTTSSAGAKGYMQMMPNTYTYISKMINQPSNMTAESNIICGSYYLRKKYDDMFNKIIHKKVYEKLNININKKISDLTRKENILYKKECLKIKNDKSYFNNNNKYIWKLALSAYNAGSSKVGYNIPNIKETQNYVKFILNL